MATSLAVGYLDGLAGRIVSDLSPPCNRRTEPMGLFNRFFGEPRRSFVRSLPRPDNSPTLSVLRLDPTRPYASIPCSSKPFTFFVILVSLTGKSSASTVLHPTALTSKYFDPPRRKGSWSVIASAPPARNNPFPQELPNSSTTRRLLPRNTNLLSTQFNSHQTYLTPFLNVAFELEPVCATLSSAQPISYAGELAFQATTTIQSGPDAKPHGPTMANRGIPCRVTFGLCRFGRVASWLPTIMCSKKSEHGLHLA